MFCHESWYLLVSAERPRTSHTVYSMTGLRPHHSYPFKRNHSHPSRRTFNRSRHASQKTEADQEMVYVPITPQ
jgi:hypothetical protein